MAKREVIGHTKLKKLCRALRIPPYAAVGLLECLWHLTAKEAPRGDIGKLSNEDIALGIDWDGDSDQLIDALVATGWVKAKEGFRLVIHDWHEHANESVKKFIARNNLVFASVEPECPDVSRNVATCPDMSRNVCPPIPLPVPVPEPVPSPLPVPEPVPGTQSEGAKRRDSFVRDNPPTVEQVAEYMKTRNWAKPAKEAEAFVAFYGQSGWKAGRSLMTDWKAAVISWESREPTRVKSSQPVREAIRR